MNKTLRLSPVRTKGRSMLIRAVYGGQVLGTKWFSGIAQERGDVNVWAQELLRENRRNISDERETRVGYKEKHWSPDEFAYDRRKNGAAVVETA